MTRTPIVLSWSGGKDSMMALARLREDPQYEVIALLTAVASEYDRISIHGVRRAILDAQAAALGLRVALLQLPPASGNDTYERAFADALARLAQQHAGLRTIAFGDLFLEDVRAYRERLVGALGWDRVYPIWGEDTARLARRFVDEGFRAALTCVDTTQLDARFCGRAYDHALLDELPAGVDPCGERGEFHTLVHDGPGFAQPVPIARGESLLRDGRFQYTDFVLT
jgi:uncharacterized protein (TIGR00290 family)